jgi:hypothetical protein
LYVVNIFDFINARVIPAQVNSSASISLAKLLHYLEVAEEDSGTPIAALEISQTQRGLKIHYLADKGEPSFDTVWKRLISKVYRYDAPQNFTHSERIFSGGELIANY